MVCEVNQLQHITVFTDAMEHAPRKVVEFLGTYLDSYLKNFMEAKEGRKHGQVSVLKNVCS
jgi:hypothetical protein